MNSKDEIELEMDDQGWIPIDLEPGFSGSFSFTIAFKFEDPGLLKIWKKVTRKIDQSYPVSYFIFCYVLPFTNLWDKVTWLNKHVENLLRKIGYKLIDLKSKIKKIFKRKIKVKPITFSTFQKWSDLANAV